MLWSNALNEVQMICPTCSVGADWYSRGTGRPVTDSEVVSCAVFIIRGRGRECVKIQEPVVETDHKKVEKWSVIQNCSCSVVIMRFLNNEDQMFFVCLSGVLKGTVYEKDPVCLTERSVWNVRRHGEKTISSVVVLTFRRSENWTKDILGTI